MNFAVFGAGYVGLVTATCFAEVGHSVTCVDTDSKKVEQLSQARPSFYEPGLAELLKKNIANGRLRFTTDAKQAVQHADVIFVAVGTPQGDDGNADMSYFYAAVQEIRKYLRDGQVLVDKSTVPVGTAAMVERLIQETGKRVSVVSNPETLREGSAVRDFMSPDRVIIGAHTEEAFTIMRDIYSPFLIREDTSRMLEMNCASAELVKYAANSMLAQRVSFINFLSQLAAKTGADIRDVRKGIGSDHRIGMHFLYPGPGFGGSCFPKDVAALAAQARAAGIEPIMLDTTLKTNDTQRAFVTQLVSDALGTKKTVGIWGLAFKARTDDVRSSSAIPLVHALLAAGKRVLVHDPQAVANFTAVVPNVIPLEKHAVLEQADVLVIMTEWDEYRTLSQEELGLLRGKTIVDCRNILARTVELEKLAANNVRYVGLGINNSALRS